MAELGNVVRTIEPKNNISDSANGEASAQQDSQEYLVVRKKGSGNCTLVPIYINGIGLKEKRKRKLMKTQFSDGTEIYIDYLDFSHAHTDKLLPTEHSMKNKKFYWEVSEAHRVHMRDIQRANAQHKAEVQKKKEQHIQKIRSDPQKLTKLTAAYEIAAMNNDRKNMVKIEKLLGCVPMKKGKYSKASRLSGSGFMHSVSGGRFSSK